MFRPFNIGACAMALLSSTSVLAQVCVDPVNSPPCFATIEEGLTAATANQTVTVAPGVYRENVTIGTSGVTLQGSSSKKVILDAEDPSEAPGIEVGAADVTIRSLTVRNGRSEGISVLATGATIEGVIVRGADDDCIRIAEAGAVVRKSEVGFCGAYGIAVGANDPNDPNDPNNLVAGVEISGNKVSQVNQFGILAFANDARIVKNSIARTGGDSILVFGANALVSKNKIKHSDDGGLDVVGSRPVVLGNKVEATADESFRIDCVGDCIGAQVVKNSCKGSAEDECFDIYADAPGLLVEGNKASDSEDDCFDIDGDTITVRGNSGARCGSNGPGFDISGSGHTVEGNKVKSSFADGFQIDGSGHSLTGNKSEGNGSDGFDVGINDTATGVTLSDNTAKNNLGEGFNVSFGATDTTLTDNSASGNRTDFCDEGTNTVTSGNSFGLPGPCEVD